MVHNLPQGRCLCVQMYAQKQLVLRSNKTTVLKRDNLESGDDQKKVERIHIRLSKEEKNIFLQKASEAGVRTISDYVRRVVLRFKLRNAYELDRELDLIKLNADQARLGNLVNQWLKKEPDVYSASTEEMLKKILSAILDNQDEIKKEIQYLRKSRTRSHE